MKRKLPTPPADRAGVEPTGGPPGPPGMGSFRAALLRHYDDARRELPWRGESDPYRILVSEVMLQQTRVETVKRYYEAWLERFPSVEALALAGEDEVLKAWEGLGYYRRARNLHRAARAVRERADRAIPSDTRGLRSLPGVGEYTAGAVASIAFGEVAPAVDGNVRRALSRVYDREKPTPAWLRRTATNLVDPERPGDWNQALMELGATVCTPTGPDCGACPVSGWCASLAAGTVERRPGAAGRREARRVRFAVGVFHRVDDPARILLVRRPKGGLLGGMWAFPEAEVDGGNAVEPSATGAVGREATGDGRGRRGGRDGLEDRGAVGPCADLEAVHRLARSLGLRPRGPVVRFPERGHRFTHLHAVYAPLAGPVAGAGEPRAAEARWVTYDQTSRLALPVAQRKILDAWRAATSHADETAP